MELLYLSFGLGLKLGLSHRLRKLEIHLLLISSSKTREVEENRALWRIFRFMRQEITG
jgi:hypothetical protein